jgi:type II secretory pathway predicted ATPase ExeA/cell division protein FtsN
VVASVTPSKQVEGYERFFGLQEPPFSLSPNPRFIFESASHTAALTEVAYVLERREPLVVITGEIGVGKTLLCRTVLQRIPRKTFLSVINDPQLERDDLLKQLLQDFGVISKDRTKHTPTSRHDLVHALQDFLGSLMPLKAHAVVIVDEAQLLQTEVLEQIRLLSNIDDERGTLLQVILVGQTDLEPMLSRPDLRQFQQRVTRRFRLERLSEDEVRQYIEHRLAVARRGPPKSGRSDNILERELIEWAKTTAGVVFVPEAVKAIAKMSAGLPRVINVICDRSLEAAFRVQQKTVDLPIVNAAARALGMEEQPAAQPPAPALVEWTALAEFDHAAARPAEPERPPEQKSEPPERKSEPAPAFEFVSRPAMPGPRRPFERPGRPAPAAYGALAAADDGTPTRRMWLMGGAGVVLIAVLIWFGARAFSPSEPASASPPEQAIPASSPAPVASAPVPTPTPEQPAPGIPAPPPVQTPPPAPVDAAPVAPNLVDAERYEIVVASFRTEERALVVAGQVTGLGLPMRRRASDGWQQVLAGPFESRADAVGAQQRLDGAGLTGTTIVAATR